MCQGHSCLTCGSLLVYRNQQYNGCLNVASTPRPGYDSCQSRTLRSCPLCNLGLWQLNVASFLYGRAGEGWMEVVYGWGAYNIPEYNRVAVHTPERTQELREQYRSQPNTPIAPVAPPEYPCNCQSCAY